MNRALALTTLMGLGLLAIGFATEPADGQKFIEARADALMRKRLPQLIERAALEKLAVAAHLPAW